VKGYRPYAPFSLRMMMALWLYGYAVVELEPILAETKGPVV
jgi:hypothetical protein